MASKKNDSSTVVKVDSSLLTEVEKLISSENYRLRFVNKKQFVDLAVQNYLQEMFKMEEANKNGNKKK